MKKSNRRLLLGLGIIGLYLIIKKKTPTPPPPAPVKPTDPGAANSSVEPANAAVGRNPYNVVV